MARAHRVAGAVLCALLVAAARAGAAEPKISAARPSAGCAAAGLEPGRRMERTIEVGGVKRTFILDVPASLKPGAPAPLMFDFHGFGHSGAGVWNVSAFRDMAEREGFITVYPTGLPVKLRLQGVEYERPGWEMSTIDGNRDLAFTTAMLDDLERRYCIDRARVFSTGFSNGAFFSSLLGCAMSDRFAAVAPVSGGPLRVACAPRRGVPVLIQHGRQDELIPVAEARRARDAWIEVDRCREATSNGCERHSECRSGAVVEYCEDDYAHRWPPQATARVWEFFRAHPMR